MNNAYEALMQGALNSIVFGGEEKTAGCATQAAPAAKPAAPAKKKRKLTAVEKEAAEIYNSFYKVAEDEEGEGEDVLSEQALDILGLGNAQKIESEEEAEEDPDEEEEALEETQDDADEEDEVKSASEYLMEAFNIEKAAAIAYEEAQIMKVAAVNILMKNKAIGTKDAEKLASMSFDEFEKIAYDAESTEKHGR